MFYVQYDTATGQISGTVSGPVAPEKLPDGRGQLAFLGWQATDGMIVDVKTGKLVDAPKE